MKSHVTSFHFYVSWVLKSVPSTLLGSFGFGKWAFWEKHVRIIRDKLGLGANYVICLTRIEKQYIKDFRRQCSIFGSEIWSWSHRKGSTLTAPVGSLPVFTKEPMENIFTQKDKVSVGGEFSSASIRARWKLKRENLWSFALNEKTKELEVQKAEYRMIVQ